LPVNSTGGYLPYQFAFPTAQSGTYSFTVREVFSDLLSFDPASNRYAFTFSAFPVVDTQSGVVKANATLLTRDWPSPIVNPGNHNVTGGKLILPSVGMISVGPFNSTTWQTTFSSTGTSQNMFDVIASRAINVAPSGTIGVTDTYNVTNKGKDAVNIAFILPAGASSTSCADVIGQLDPTSCPTSALGDNSVSLTFSARFGNVKHNGAAVAILHYSLPSNQYVSVSGLGGYILNFQMFNGVKFVTAALQTRITLPTGAKLGAVTGQTPIVSGNQILLQASSVSPFSNLAFSMAYQLDPFWASLNPLGWTAMVEGAFAALALVIVSGSQGSLVASSPLQLITRFVELCDEKSSMGLEGEKLEDDVNRGAVNRYDYRRRRRVMDLRMVELDKLMVPLKEKLADEQPRYEDRIKRIERAEAELQQVKTSLADLKNQNRTGRISRDLYEQLSGDLSRRKTRAQQAIDNIIIDFREEAR